MVCLKRHSNECQDQGFHSITSHCRELISYIHFKLSLVFICHYIINSKVVFLEDNILEWVAVGCVHLVLSARMQFPLQLNDFKRRHLDEF